MGIRDNIRFIHTNIADEASYFPNSESLVYPISNALVDDRTKVYRSEDSAFQIIVTWPTTQTLSAVVLAYTSLKNTGTYRVRLYADLPGAVLLYDTGITAFKSITAEMHPIVHRPIYFNETSSVIRMVLDLDDTVSGVDHIEIGRFIFGKYWAPKFNIDMGYTVTYNDSSSNFRNISGNNSTKLGVKYKTIEASLSHMTNADMDALDNIRVTNSVHKPMFVSLFPTSPNSDTEQVYQIYGTFGNLNDISYTSLDVHSTSISLEEI